MHSVFFFISSIRPIVVPIQTPETTQSFILWRGRFREIALLVTNIQFYCVLLHLVLNFISFGVQRGEASLVPYIKQVIPRMDRRSAS